MRFFLSRRRQIGLCSFIVFCSDSKSNWICYTNMIQITKQIKVLKYKRNHNRIVHDFITREPCSLTTRVDYEVSLNMKMHRKYLFVRKMHHILQV